MAKSSTPARAKSNKPVSPLMVRLDKDSKAFLVQAAKLRRISVSDYVRIVTVAQARREVEAAGQQTIGMSPDEFRAFWEALNEVPHLTQAQKKLGALMRGQRR
jgi:uncharacterized protein (DUF1778 family)